jgi:ABC-type nitrate/sulfonate/bicarbonate transport system substrate-binding protein
MVTSSPASTPPAPVPVPGATPRPLRLGFVALTDSAPLAVAEHLGLFAQHGLRVDLRREIGWATLREKIIYGELDAAHAPAPMLWSTHLGLGCPATEVLTALVLNLHGNAVTFSRALWEAGARDAALLRALAKERRARQPLTFGIASHFSTPHLMLRDWLLAAGLNPERDVRIVVVPPAQLLRNLAAGTIDGYGVGEPWNTLAVRENVGWCPTWSAVHAPGHVEKVLMVTRRFASRQAEQHAALVAALTAACAWCDEPQNREPLAQLLAGPTYLNVPARVIAPALLGRFDCGHGRVENIPDFHVFHRYEANLPTAAKAAALQRSLGAAGLLSDPHATAAALPARLFRADLHRAAVGSSRGHRLVGL